MPQSFVNDFEHPPILMVLEARLIFKLFFIAKNLFMMRFTFLGEIA
jgi:hypothetical protein